MINQLPMSWVTSTLEATRRFLKKWVGLARAANPSRLYVLKSKGTLGCQPLACYIKTPPHLTLLSNTVTGHQGRARFTQANTYTNVGGKGYLAGRPMGQQKYFQKRAKTHITECDSEERLESARNLQQRTAIACH